eukprot:Hpha_TRINITY_DN709_c0_g1::TRINITY_DN709_c0_g1_i1::g.28999::m.28999
MDSSRVIQSGLSWSSADRYEHEQSTVPQSPLAHNIRKMTARISRVSLAAANVIGYLSRPEELSGHANAAWIAWDVEAWCTAVSEARGIVDLISGDRRFASFNARQSCSEHPNAAVGVLSSRGGPEGWELSGCVATGMAVCGDYGSYASLRFMVLGGLSSLLYPLERVAAGWRTKVLVNGEAHASACYKWDGKLVGAVFHAKCGDRPIRLYSITSPRGRGLEGGGPDEWMYELAKLAAPQHEEANQATEKLMKERLDILQSGTMPTSPAEEGRVWRMEEVGMVSL